jgi:CheY-like chemotaxis protein
MDEATLARIFEPFFTSNTEGGNGLGLATVLENVESCGGDIHVESTPGKGTTVTLLFSVSPPRKEETPSRTHLHSAAMTGGQILLVEDREDVRTGIQQILEHEGYVIRACGTVEEAKALEATYGIPDLLICDAILSDESAGTLVKFLRSIAPRLPVLVMSGYPKEEITLDSAFSEIEFLAKPFTGLTLLERVGQLVGEGN